MKIGGIKKLGRVHNCCGGCSLIREHLTQENFLKIFNVTGNYTVESVEGYWGGIDSINDNNQYNSGHDDTLVFSGSCSLELISEKANFANDNFGMQLDVDVSLSGSQSENCVETLTFTTDNQVISNVFTLDASTGERTLEIKLNNNTVYRYIPGDELRIDVSNDNYFVNGRKFFLVKKDGVVDYYVTVPNIGFLYIARILGHTNAPIEVEYSYNTDHNATKISFSPYCFQLWKPDRWWSTLAFSPYIRQTLSDNSGFETCMNALYSDALEKEGCESPQNITTSEQNTLIDTLCFQALSPKFRLRLSGLKGFSGEISPKDSVITGYWWTLDRTNPPGSATQHVDITPDDVPGLRAALNAGTANINSYLEAYAQTLESEGKCYTLSWRNGGIATLDYSKLYGQLNFVTGQRVAKLVETNPATVLTAYECVYPDTELSYYPYIQQHTANELHGEWEYDYYAEEWKYNKWGYTQGASFTKPVRYLPDGEQRQDGYAEDQCYIGGEVSYHYGIVAYPVSEKIPRNGTLTLSFQDTFAITKNNGVNKTSKLQYGHQVVSLQVTKNPVHGSCVVSSSYYPYTIVYSANATNEDKADSFEFELTDQFGTKSKNVVIVEFDDNASASKTVENPCNNFDPQIGIEQDYWRGAGYDYYTLIRAYLTIVGMGNVEIFSYSRAKDFSLGSSRFTARYIKALDIETDSEGNIIRQLYSLDGQAQDELLALFTPATGSTTIYHQNNFALADEYSNVSSDYIPKNVSYIGANVTTYYKQDFYAEDYTKLEDIQCVLNPAHDYTEGNEIGALGRGNTIYYSGSFEYSFTADGSEQTSIVYLTLTSQLNNTLPYCIGYDKGIIVDYSSYNYMGAYKINSFTVYYEDGSTATVSDW